VTMSMVVILMILIMRSKEMSYEILLPYFVFSIGISTYHLTYAIRFDDIE
jgi:hypothetical protein